MSCCFVVLKVQFDGEHNDHNTEQTEENSLRADSSYNYEASGIEQVHHANYVDDNISPGLDVAYVIPSRNGERRVGSSINRQFLLSCLVLLLSCHHLSFYNLCIFQVHDSLGESHDDFQSKLNLQQISSQLHEVLRVDSREHFIDSKVR